MAPILYSSALSAPCRSVQLAAKAFGVKLELNEVNLLKGEHMAPAFVAINPQHTVPILIDGEVTLWESRAILQYLANQYGKNDSLYPKDPKTRARVDQMIYFDFGTLFPTFYNFFVPVMQQNKKPSSESLGKIHEALVLLELYLDGHFFAVGNRMTIADFALVATVSSMEAIGVEMIKYPNVKRWLGRCMEQMPGHKEINGSACSMMEKMLKPKMRI